MPIKSGDSGVAGITAGASSVVDGGISASKS